MAQTIQKALCELDSIDTRRALKARVLELLEFADRCPVMINKRVDDVFPLCIVLNTILSNWDQYYHMKWITPSYFIAMAEDFSQTDFELMFFVDKTLQYKNIKLWEFRRHCVEFFSNFSFVVKKITQKQLDLLIHKLLGKLINLA